MKNSTTLEHKSIKLLCFVIAAGSAIMTGYFGSNFGGDHWFFQSILFAIFFSLSVLCPLLCNWTTSYALHKNVGCFAVLLPFALVFVFADIVTNGGTSAFLRKSDLVLTENQNTKAKDVRGEVLRLQTRIEDIRKDTAWTGNYRAPGAYDKLIESGEKYVAMEAARGGCKTKCEARMRELDSLRAERANAARREALKAEMVTLERELKDAKVASAETPTRASAALTHAKNLAAGLTGQIDPGEEPTFWANYKLAALTGIIVTLASMAASILLAFSGAMQGGHQPREQEAPTWDRNPLPDLRPTAAAEAQAGRQSIVLNSNHTDDSIALMMEAVNRINAKYAT